MLACKAWPAKPGQRHSRTPAGQLTSSGMVLVACYGTERASYPVLSMSSRRPRPRQDVDSKLSQLELAGATAEGGPRASR